MEIKTVIKRGVITFLVTSMICIGIPGLYVNAEEVDSVNNTSEESIQQDKENCVDNILEDSQSANDSEKEETSRDIDTQHGKLNYFYVYNPYLETPDTQEIVVSYGDGTENVQNMILSFEKSDGTNGTMQLDERNVELYRFSKAFSETESGVYVFTSITITENGIDEIIDLQELGIEAQFGVDMEYPGYEATTGNMEDELETSVVVLNGDEIQSAEEKIGESIDETANQISGLDISTYAVNGVVEAKSNSNSDDIVVVLDPGHGGSDPGTSGNGLVEKDLTLKIATYAKQELENYDGVQVYMTRTSDVYVELEDRVEIAKQYGADVLVSIHINSGGGKGAEVYYPNANYRPDLSQEGKGLAEKIQQELVALGLYDRGIKIRTSQSNSYYDDGSATDYYSIIRNSKKAGFPGLIIEHAFVDNVNDVNNYLNSDEKLKKLGIADATGIAEYFGLDSVRIPDGVYTLKTALDLELAMEVDQESTENNGNIQLGKVSDSASQKFYISYVGSGYYRIVNANSGRVLDVENISSASGANLQQYAWNGGDSQLWRFVDAGNGTYYIKSKLGTVIDCQNGIAQPGNNIQMYSKNDTVAQQWNIEETEFQPIENGTYRLKSVLDNSKVMDIENHSMEDGAAVEINSIEDSESQEFEVEYVGNGYYTIKNKNSGKMLDVYNALTTDGTKIQQFSENGNDAQKWQFIVSEDGSFYIESKLGTYIDIKDGNSERGTNLQTHSFNGSAAQKWEFTQEEISIANIEAGAYRICIADNNDYVLDVENASSANMTNIQLWKNNGNAAQIFYILEVGNGYYRIVNALSGKVLDVENVSPNAGANLQQYAWNGVDGQLWRFIETTDNQYYIESALGTRIDLTNGNVKNGTNIQLYTAADVDAQKWCLESVDYKPIQNGTYDIASGLDSTKVCDIVNGSMENEAKVQLYTKSDVPAQQFNVEYVSNGYYKILNRGSTKALSIENDGTTPGSLLIQSDFQNLDSQLWLIIYVGDGQYNLCTKSGLYIDITNGNVNNGNILQGYTFNGTGYQKWQLVTSSIRNENIEDGVYWISSSINNDQMLDIENGSLNNNGNVQIWEKNGLDAQLYDITYIGQGYYRILNVASGKSLDVTNGNPASGVNLQQYTWNGERAQLWKIIDNSDGVYLESALGTRIACVDSNAKNGSNVVLMDPSADPEQCWKLQKVDDYQPVKEGVYEIAMSININRVLDIVNGVVSDGNKIQIYERNNTPAQQYQIEYVEDGYYKITNYKSKKVLDIENGSTEKGAKLQQYEWNGGDGQLWRFIYAGNNAYYICSKSGLYIDLTDGNSNIGNKIQVYSFNGSDAQKWMFTNQSLTPIMGETLTSVEQLVRYYNANAVYPDFYKNSDAKSITDFCNIYIEEAAKEGIRAEVAFCQAMKETAFLRFTGDVKIEQYNFAGIGATGGGNPGNTFPSVRIGIRAQIQHLKAYATAEKLNLETVDPRYDYVNKGSAPYTEWLGKYENPLGIGWAASVGYGYSIVNDYMDKLSLY